MSASLLIQVFELYNSNKKFKLLVDDISESEFDETDDIGGSED